MGKINMKTIFNLSYDIPENIKKTTQPNLLTRKELVKTLIKEGAINLNNSFTIYHNHVPVKNVNIAYIVKTTLIFASNMDKNEIAQILSKFTNNLYYVLTAVEEEQNEYLAKIIEDQELQDGFNNELKEIMDEIKNE